MTHSDDNNHQITTLLSNKVMFGARLLAKPILTHLANGSSVTKSIKLESKCLCFIS